MFVELAGTAGRTPAAVSSFQFTEHRTLIVGRSAQAHFSLPEKDPHVSRLHVLFEVNPPQCRLRDMGGGGTVVNGRKVAQADLADGDRITIGVTEITVRLHDTEPAVEARTLALPGHHEPALATPATLSFHVAAGGPHTQPEATPPTIPGYAVERVLGRGGMGVVYRATHLATGEPVAVKTILDHPGVVRFRDSGVAAGTVWFAMEFVPGADAQRTADAAGVLGVGWSRPTTSVRVRSHPSSRRAGRGCWR